MKVLQTFALPLGYGTKLRRTHSVHRNHGAVDETRTRDLHLGKVALYQLSYYRKWCPGTESNHRHVDFQSTALPTELPGQMATRKGLEPSTSSVTGWHSNQLNYRAMQWAFRDLNPGPIGYEPTALTTELKALNLYCHGKRKWRPLRDSNPCYRRERAVS